MIKLLCKIASFLITAFLFVVAAVGLTWVIGAGIVIIVVALIIDRSFATIRFLNRHAKAT